MVLWGFKEGETSVLALTHLPSVAAALEDGVLFCPVWSRVILPSKSYPKFATKKKKERKEKKIVGELGEGREERRRSLHERSPQHAAACALG